MNCQEALDKLYHLIDEESTSIEEGTIREHLSHCTNCSDIFKLEKAVNDFVLAKIRKNSVPAELTNLKSRILEELDTIDCNGKQSN